MKKLIFIRHSESLSNVGHSKANNLSNADIPLTSNGQQMAEKLAQSWDIAPQKIYTSEFLRTQQTATPLCQKFGISAVPLVTLNECDTIGFDIAKTLSPEDKLTLIKRYWHTSDPDEKIGILGESYKEFCQRVQQFQHLLPELDHHSIIIGHGMWLAQFIWQILKLGDPKSLSHNMTQFGHFFMNLPLPNLIQFEITLSHHQLSISQRY